MSWLRRRPDGTREAEHLIDRLTVNIRHGRFERSLSGLTAVPALITTVEVFNEHNNANFGNKWMWSPIPVTPPLVISGTAGVYSRRWPRPLCRSRRGSTSPTVWRVSTSMPAGWLASPADSLPGNQWGDTNR